VCMHVHMVCEWKCECGGCEGCGNWQRRHSSVHAHTYLLAWRTMVGQREGVRGVGATEKDGPDHWHLLRSLSYSL